VVIGIALGSNPELRGRLTGLDGRFVNCTNQSTEQVVKTPISQVDWSCTDLGLDVSTRNLVRQQVLGVAP
jgi:hypothetical protein